MFRYIIRPLLFSFDPETIHHVVFRVFRLVCAIPPLLYITRKLFVINDPRLETTVAGLHFPNPVGLAAGFDKDATLFTEIENFGFGFIEIGTVTPLAQPGNPKPRMFRLLKDSAIINRMGFNNHGVEAAALRLKEKRGKSSVIIGGNIGKNKITPVENAVDDYAICFTTLFPYVDYFVVNVSSPNTPGLRGLQDREPLEKLLRHLCDLNNKEQKPKPIFLKIAPDLTESELNDIIAIVQETRIAGVVATNTTISRDNLRTDNKVVTEIGAGGLSGKPLKNRSTEVIRYLHTHSGGSFDLIAVGGVFTPEDALEKLDAGAKLVQLYTGFIYNGPQLVKDINRAILKKRSNLSL